MSEDKVIDFLRGRFAHIDERFDRVELKLDKLTTRTSAVEREVGALHRNIADGKLQMRPRPAFSG